MVGFALGIRFDGRPSAPIAKTIGIATFGRSDGYDEVERRGRPEPPPACPLFGCDENLLVLVGSVVLTIFHEEVRQCAVLARLALIVRCGLIAIE